MNSPLKQYTTRVWYCDEAEDVVIMASCPAEAALRRTLDDCQHAPELDGLNMVSGGDEWHWMAHHTQAEFSVCKNPEDHLEPEDTPEDIEGDTFSVWHGGILESGLIEVRPMPERTLRKADVVVSLGSWRMSNGTRGPRGRGHWGFWLCGHVSSNPPVEFWATGNVTYSEAKRQAVAEAARLGYVQVEVLP